MIVIECMECLAWGDHAECADLAGASECCCGIPIDEDEA